MSVSELPTASAVSTDDSETVSIPVVAEEIDVPTYVAAAKHFDAADLFKIISALLKMAEKLSKTVGKSSSKRGTTVKKAKDAPKGKTPRQLHKNNAWVAWTLEYARQNGWESFIVKAKSKDKETGDVTEEEIEMPSSELHDGCYVYEGSVTESTPAGRQIIHKEAMSLSKHYWSAKNETGTRQDLYEEFLKTYEEPVESETESVAKSTTSSKATVRKTAAEKAEEKAAKEKAAAEEKERKAKEREAQKAERASKKAAEREAIEQRKAERAEAKATKEKAAAEEKERKEAEKATKVKKTAVKATPVKAAAAVAVVKTVPAKPVPAAAKPVAAPAPAPVKAAGGAGAKRPVEEWVAPAEGQVKSWSFKGKTYFRNSDNELWLKKADGQMGDWQGVYLPSESRIDDSVPEPVFEEEE
jgi:hypothetical protein